MYTPSATTTEVKPAFSSLPPVRPARPVTSVPLCTVMPAVRSALPEESGSGVSSPPGVEPPSEAAGVSGAGAAPVGLLPEPPEVCAAPCLSRATAPQATSGTTMSTTSSGIQLRHAGT